MGGEETSPPPTWNRVNKFLMSGFFCKEYYKDISMLFCSLKMQPDNFLGHSVYKFVSIYISATVVVIYYLRVFFCQSIYCFFTEFNSPYCALSSIIVNALKVLCIPESFNTNILRQLFDYTIALCEFTSLEHKFKR